MNRRILFAVLAVGSLALVATGCEKKEATKDNTEPTTTVSQDRKITCEQSEEEDGINKKLKFVFEFKGDTMAKASISATNTYKDKADEAEYNKIKTQCSEALAAKNRKGYTCNTQTSGRLISAYWQFTIADLTEDGWKLAKDTMGLDEVKDFNYDKTKSTFETIGYTCK